MNDLIRDKEKAKRLARVIVSDIFQYNLKKVENGIMQDSLLQDLENEIEEGKTYYFSKVDPSIIEHENFFEIALVDILIKSKSDMDSKIW